VGDNPIKKMALMLGWEHVRQNLGWPVEYEKWPTFLQQTYEDGRQMAVEVRAALIGSRSGWLEAWPSLDSLPPETHRVLAERACWEQVSPFSHRAPDPKLTFARTPLPRGGRRCR
jgi:hypothetical protein